MALAETDYFGNPVNSWSIPCVTYGLTSKQRAAVIGDAVKNVIAIAVSRCKPIVVEKLDFSRKKAAIEAESRKYCRMLSALAYSHIQATIRARAFDAGIEVLSANPAYSTLIGKHKFSVRYGLSAHQAAACVIARRVYGLSERLPGQLRVTLPLSARNRGRHVWSMWAVVSHRDRAAHEVLRRPGRKARSLTAPAGGQTGTARFVIQPPYAGAIPARESSSALFGGRYR
ncbi:MAG: IS200/IS605 family element transposase accessory protein TnpB [Desulfomonile tiedjei]|nr:IS200/IS605 family element transposase accessory protein TnpB [Desulfomonile tiedjei]